LHSGTNISVTSTIDTNGFDTQATGRLQGVGGLAKAGTGILTLTNTSNSYSGGTLISAGTLKQGAANALVDNTDYIVNTGGTLDLNDFSLTASSLSGTGGTV